MELKLQFIILRNFKNNQACNLQKTNKLKTLRMIILSNQFNFSQEIHFRVINKQQMMAKVICRQKIFKVRKYNKLIIGL
jgi:hypothetical protein